MGFGFNIGRLRFTTGVDKTLIYPLLSKEVYAPYDTIDIISESELKNFETSIRNKLSARKYQGYRVQLQRNVDIFTPNITDIAFYLMDTIFPKNSSRNDPSTWGVVSLFLFKTDLKFKSGDNLIDFPQSAQRLVIYTRENFSFFYPIIKTMITDRDFSACSIDIKLKSKNPQLKNAGWGTYARIYDISEVKGGSQC
jgi:hypothetical protein